MSNENTNRQLIVVVVFGLMLIAGAGVYAVVKPMMDISSKLNALAGIAGPGRFPSDSFDEGTQTLTSSAARLSVRLPEAPGRVSDSEPPTFETFGDRNLTARFVLKRPEGTYVVASSYVVGAGPNFRPEHAQMELDVLCNRNLAKCEGAQKNRYPTALEGGRYPGMIMEGTMSDGKPFQMRAYVDPEHPHRFLVAAVGTPNFLYTSECRRFLDSLRILRSGN